MSDLVSSLVQLESTINTFWSCGTCQCLNQELFESTALTTKLLPAVLNDRCKLSTKVLEELGQCTSHALHIYNIDVLLCVVYSSQIILVMFYGICIIVWVAKIWSVFNLTLISCCLLNMITHKLLWAVCCILIFFNQTLHVPRR